MTKPAPKKIALLLSGLKCGGAERVALNLSEAFKDEGLLVDILVMRKEGEFLSEAEKHYRVVDLACSRTYELPGKLFMYLLKRRPDVLLVSFWKLNLCACVVRILFPSLKLLLWEHSLPSKSKNSPKWLYAITASLFYQLSHKVVAVSAGVCNDIDRWSVGLRRKLVVIPNPIKPPNSRFLNRRKLKGSDRRMVISVGRLEEPKNPQLLLDAFALVPKGCNATLQFIGDGRLRGELVQRSKALGIEGRVRFLGYQSEPYEYISAGDLLVVSSDREGFGNVIVEAMYCGLRVVSTDCGEGVRDILLNGRYGIIVPTQDKYALARAIEVELGGQHSFEQQRDGAQRFLPKVIVQRFLALIS